MSDLSHCENGDLGRNSGLAAMGAAAVAWLTLLAGWGLRLLPSAAVWLCLVLGPAAFFLGGVAATSPSGGRYRLLGLLAMTLAVAGALATVALAFGGLDSLDLKHNAP
jgi:hypothetical protein